MPEPTERPPISGSPINVVLLAHNDEPTVDEVIGKWTAYLDSLDRKYEIILVDDGSTDGTGEIADSLTRAKPGLRVMHHVKKQGPGAALRTGLRIADLPIFFYSDCSGSYEPKDLAKFLELIDQVDVVSGYPAPEKRKISPSWRKIGYRWTLRWLFGVRLKDVDCLFNLFRRSIFARIPIQSNGRLAHAEIMAKANFLGCLMAEAAVSFVPRTSGSWPPIAGELRMEAAQLFRQPDFGPIQVPSNVPETGPKTG